MNKKLKALIAVLCTLPIIIMMGCAVVQDVATPCFVEQEVIEYVQKHIPEVEPTSILPWTTLFDAKRLDCIMNNIHIDNQIVFERLLLDENRTYARLKDSHNYNMESAKEVQGIAFSPTGPLGFLTVAGLAGTGGALLIKRPGDKSKKQIMEANTGSTKAKV